jgi:hypothetical protein
MNLKRLAALIVALGVLTLVVALGVLTFLGTGSARYTDVSGDPAHAGWVGQRCVVLKGLRAHGFTLDLRKRDVTYEVVVTTLPGIGGPEITFKTPVPKGTTFTVTSVRKCWNCPLDRISYGVEIHGIQELKAHKVFAMADVLGPDEAQCGRNR